MARRIRYFTGVLALSVGIFACSKTNPGAAPAAPQKNQQQPTPSPTPGPAPAPVDVTQENCAEQIILAAAKKNVAQKFGNAPESGGQCALGVRESLQLSGVGGITGGIGNAIDFLQVLKPYGFEDSGLRDPNKTPPGAIIIFSGPHSTQYLSTGKYGSPPGDWLGHVTIKGDDGFYYTDARTSEPAIGWEKGVNVEGIRDVAGIYVPDPALIAKYKNDCASQALASSEISVEAPSAEREGHRLASAAALQFQTWAKLPVGDSTRLQIFRGTLALAKQAAPYDGEARLAHMIADAIVDDPSLRSEFSAGLGQPDCNGRMLKSSVDHLLCMKAHGVTGQDGAVPECANTFDYGACPRQ